MRMVIFGAGASYDSSPTYPIGTGPPGATADDSDNAFHRPPLARDLFANRPLFIQAIELFPQCKTIVPRLRAASVRPDRSVETLLQEIEQEAKAYPRGLRELAAVQCYIQRAISECEIHWLRATGGITNYLTLLREIERTHQGPERVCVVTFNYDTLLENALTYLGQNIERMDDYINASGLFRVFKLHGSVNWARFVENRIPVLVNPQSWVGVLRYLIENATSLRISSDFVMCDPAKPGVIENKPTFPAIAIPVEKKNQFACPQVLIDELIRTLPHVSEILVVGWRATENHFLDLLQKHLRAGANLYIVAGSSEGELTKTNLYQALFNNRPQSGKVDPGGFTAFLDSGRARSYLES